MMKFNFPLILLINYYIIIRKQIINDIFNYYISGYPDIPEEYLYQNNDYNL